MSEPTAAFIRMRELNFTGGLTLPPTATLTLNQKLHNTYFSCIVFVCRSMMYIRMHRERHTRLRQKHPGWRIRRRSTVGSGGRDGEAGGVAEGSRDRPEDDPRPQAPPSVRMEPTAFLHNPLSGGEGPASGGLNAPNKFAPA